MRRRLFICLTALTALTGCTVVSYDRVLPKVTWAWTSEAREQCRQDAERRQAVQAYQDSLRTNSPAKAP